MNDLKIFENAEFGKIRVVMNGDEPMFCLADVCKVLEIGNPSQTKTRLKKDGVITNEVSTPIVSQGIDTGKTKTTSMTFINEPNLYKLIFQSRKESAERFTDWVTSEVLPSIRKTGGYAVTKKNSTTTEEAISWIAFVGKELGLNGSSKLLLMKQWGDMKGLPTPDYVSSKDVLLSASELLKRNGKNMSARVFNVAMIEKGFLEECKRPSKGGEKYFKRLTERGLVFGENQISPSNPKETQPLYYETTFNQLLKEIVFCD